ncbi:MAG: signal peptidase II [Anaerolineales bacterium]|nr:signal peptidase II [Anaerolineales bacterium]
MKKYYSLLFTAGLVVALDQWTKWLVRTNIPLHESWLPESLNWLSSYARIVFIYNSGAAFGMFQNANLLFAAFAFLVIGIILYSYPKIEEGDGSLRLASGLYLSGVLGNLIDRLTMGKVTDFISVGNFYIFNIADASINIAVVILLISFWVSERKKPVASSENEVLPTNGELS